MYTSYNNRVTREHKRNQVILNDILMNIDIRYVKYHKSKLNK